MGGYICYDKIFTIKEDVQQDKQSTNSNKKVENNKDTNNESNNNQKDEDENNAITNKNPT
ncbi:MAG: hypothetical protein J6B89_00290 [Bacilli bacterium]|nr:hypothetical protein [Bacilli bacterium]